MTSDESWSKVKVHFLKIGDAQKQGESLKIRKKPQNKSTINAVSTCMVISFFVIEKFFI